MKSEIRVGGELWLADYDKPYHGKDPYFYNPNEYAWVRYVEDNWETIRDEFLSIVTVNHDDFMPYPDLEKTDKKDAWHTAGLMYWTQKSKKIISRFPKTWAIMRKVPNISSCSFHLLEPHSTIKPHIGDTNVMLRCHIGIVIPAQAPRCGIRVGKETQCWEEGKILIFNDAHEHTAWNNTDKNRYVMSFDVMRPEFVKKRHWVASQVLGKIFVEVAYQHLAPLKKYLSANWIKNILFFLSKNSFRAMIAIRSAMYRNV